MGKGIRSKSFLTIGSRIANDVVIPVELTPQEMQMARIGGEVPVINATGINDGDFVEFVLMWDNVTQTIVADKLQKDPTIRGIVYSGQTLPSVTINPKESVVITQCNIQKIQINGGMVVIDKSTIGEIEDTNIASDVFLTLFNSTINNKIKLDTASSVIFVGDNCTFNGKIIIKNNPKILCISDGVIDKLSVK